ncbi:hypothetical protein PPEP_a1635 [Pseudoalteromonas peptidolytica F12-50-A1]|uniref:Uncharacterized protein n=1 Tax=Pseudoalteromonas peptidolytica F12-50-A1 TaxID=1315280 RepID=A0A8I0MWJ4_9GAMM|nr:hypothetical protein [Pseudoalteromonas peptidolytica F12-50-A1]
MGIHLPCALLKSSPSKPAPTKDNLCGNTLTLRAIKKLAE